MMKMFVAGDWVASGAMQEVRSPYDGTTVDSVPLAGPNEVEAALASAVRGAKVMAGLTAYQRHAILMNTAGLLAARAEEFAQTLTREMGKTIAEARAEVSRAVHTLTLSAEEGRRVTGETL